MAFVLALSDSLLSAHKSFGLHELQLQDSGDSFHTCLCVASGCSLMKPWDLRSKDPESSVSIALRALESGTPSMKRFLVDDPPARVIIVNSRSSISYCRKSGEEEFPRLVSNRQRSPLVTRLETPWTLCDLDDVITQRDDRRRFDELEVCKLRHEKGMYSESDYYHMRRDVGRKAVAEVIKATRRTALSRQHENFKRNGIIIVIAAGWNLEYDTYAKLDASGKAWLRADIVASAELCALDGHPISAFMKKMRELVGRRRGNHSRFLRQPIGSIRKLRPPVQIQQGKKRKKEGSSTSRLACSKRCKKEGGKGFPFPGRYIGNWYQNCQEVVIYPDWTYIVPGYVEHGRVTEVSNDTASKIATYRLRRSDKSSGKAHYFRFVGSRAYGTYDISPVSVASNSLWTLVGAEACMGA